jgi:hypothetical protein
MPGFTVASGFARFFQPGQRGITAFSLPSRLNLDSQRHVKLTKE